MVDSSRVIVFSPQDEFVCELAPADVFERVRTEEVNGEHSMTVTTTRVLTKAQRVLTCDANGKWREWVVSGTDSEHASGARPLGTYYCVWALQYDLALTKISREPGVQVPVTAAVALDAALDGTARWVRGTVTQTTTGGASMYRMDGWSALGVLVDTWGGEVDATIEVGESGVISRKVDLYAHQGSAEPTRRFDWGNDVLSIKRTVADEPTACRVIPYGKGEQTEGGGYGRKIDITSVNDGVEWLQDDESAALYRLPDGAGGWEYPARIIENGDIDDPQALKDWALGVMHTHTRPQVTYQASVLQLATAGFDFRGVALGDEVQVVDRGFDDAGLELQGRVLKVATNELDEADVVLTIDTLGGSIASRFAKFEKVQDAVVAMNGGTLSTAEYLTRLIDRINGEVNAAGGFTYIVPGHGLLTYDTAVSDPTIGAEASQVVEIKGGSVRIANSRNGQGEWEWRTVFVSGRVAADMVTAANITAGYIGSASGGNFWDLDNGVFRLANTAMVGTKTAAEIAAGIDATITGVDVEFAESQSATVAPTGGWSTTSPTWRDGWYIWQRTVTTTPSGTSYSAPTMISGKNGEDGSDGTSVTILGSYATVADLQREHPTGTVGDAYIVAGDLYVWTGAAWENVGQIQGPAGTNGADGRGIASVTEQYYLSTSDETPQGGEWKTEPDPYEAGKFYFTRTIVAWTDSTVTMTSPVLAQGINSANETATAATEAAEATAATVGHIRGDNVLPYTTAVGIATGWAVQSGGGATPVLSKFDYATIPAPTSVGWPGVATPPMTFASLKDRELTFSVNAQPDGADTVNVTIQVYISHRSADGSFARFAFASKNFPASKGRVQWSFTMNEAFFDTPWPSGSIPAFDPATDLVRFYVFDRSASVGVKLSQWKLEAGPEATDWRASEEAFQRLTDGGTNQGVYMDEGRLYVNADWIKSGTIEAARIGANTITADKINVQDLITPKVGSSANNYANIGNATSPLGGTLDGLAYHNVTKDTGVIVGVGSESDWNAVSLGIIDNNGNTDTRLLLDSRAMILRTNTRNYPRFEQYWSGTQRAFRLRHYETANTYFGLAITEYGVYAEKIVDGYVVSTVQIAQL